MLRCGIIFFLLYYFFPHSLSPFCEKWYYFFPKRIIFSPLIFLFLTFFLCFVLLDCKVNAPTCNGLPQSELNWITKHTIVNFKSPHPDNLNWSREIGAHLLLTKAVSQYRYTVPLKLTSPPPG